MIQSKTDQTLLIRALVDFNVSQQTLASMLGVSYSSLHRWLKGKPIAQRKLVLLALASLYVIRDHPYTIERFTEILAQTTRAERYLDQIVKGVGS